METPNNNVEANCSVPLKTAKVVSWLLSNIKPYDSNLGKKIIFHSLNWKNAKNKSRGKNFGVGERNFFKDHKKRSNIDITRTLNDLKKGHQMVLKFQFKKETWCSRHVLLAVYP